jgi:thiamine-monophosphate kinase
MATEFERIASIMARAHRPSTEVLLGIGDDGALLRQHAGSESVVTTDLLVEGVHFRLDWLTPELLGRKAIAVSLSDIAAMGATPRAAFVSLAIPQRLDDAFFEAFFTGVISLCDRHGVTLAGGDLSSSPGPLVVDSTLIGEAEAGRALRRSGARPGDSLYVSGTLGSSAAGLAQLLAGVTLDTATTGTDLDSIRSHLAPMPRVELGRALAQTGLASAAIDVSDGLSSDLRHLCRASGVGAVVDVSALPTHVAREYALHGGEQYELLFAGSPAHAGRIELLATELHIELTRIGRFEGPPDEVLLISDGHRAPLEPRGWEHFR